jgi:Amt family ammonium transporter
MSTDRIESGYRKWIGAGILCLIVLGSSVTAADSPGEAVVDAAAVKDELQMNMNIIWTCIAAFLVFFMQAGFAMVEAGFTRAKNSVNILMKNLMDFSIGTPVYFLIGFGLMFGVSNGLFGTTLFGMSGTEPGNHWNWTFLIFQTVFAATAATIVSGAMAERTKFIAYLIYSAVISLAIYPVFGSWAWGNLLIPDNPSWLANAGFHDFAGSTVVHSIGGWLALSGAIILGPRLGKYSPDGKPKAIPGHNIPLAALGVFILWFGWFGFNPGSTLTANDLAGYIAVTTNLAAAAGAISSLITSWLVLKKPDISMTLNGTLAGLVAITAPCDGVSPTGAMIIGAVGGILVVFSVLFFDYVVKVDDPVGAVSVHAVNGLWGTLSYGLFAINGGLFYGGGFKQLGIQILGAGTAFVWAFGLGLILFWIISKTVGLRVSAEEEMKGLDIGEHGMEAYSGFQIFSTM